MDCNKLKDSRQLTNFKCNLESQTHTHAQLCTQKLTGIHFSVEPITNADTAEGF